MLGAVHVPPCAQDGVHVAVGVRSVDNEEEDNENISIQTKNM